MLDPTYTLTLWENSLPAWVLYSHTAQRYTRMAHFILTYHTMNHSVITL